MADGEILAAIDLVFSMGYFLSTSISSLTIRRNAVLGLLETGPGT